MSSIAGLCKIPGVGSRGGVGVGQDPAMELFASSRVLLNAATGHAGGTRVGVG